MSSHDESLTVPMSWKYLLNVYTVTGKFIHRMPIEREVLGITRDRFCFQFSLSFVLMFPRIIRTFSSISGYYCF